MTVSAISETRPTASENDDLSFLNEAILPGEEPQKYRHLRKRIADTIKPKDVFEEFWVADVANQVWETARYRKMVVNLLNATKQRALEKLLHDLVHWEDALGVNGFGTPFHMKSEYLAWKYVRKDVDQETATAINEVDRVLREAGFDSGTVIAEAVSLRSNELKNINQMLAKAETRRAATLRAIERHRVGLGAQLQAVANKEFEQAELHDARERAVVPKLAA